MLLPISQTFELEELTARLASKKDTRYLEFLRVRDMHAGLYELRAGERDPQTPHAEDEIYFVIAGRGDFRAEERLTPVGPGSVLYVRAGIEHRFENIVEDLRVLVVFAAGRRR